MQISNKAKQTLIRCLCTVTVTSDPEVLAEGLCMQ